MNRAVTLVTGGGEGIGMGKTRKGIDRSIPILFTKARYHGMVPKSPDGRVPRGRLWR